jgi:large subunit ribosomal protein L5
LTEFKYIPRLRELYQDVIFRKLKEHGNYTNDLAVPRIESIVLTCLLGKKFTNKALMQSTRDDIKLITGQVPSDIFAKRSEAGFSVRQGDHIGYKVTLRSNKMYEFIDRFINTALPEQKRFFGYKNKSFDGKGNFSVGVADISIFPEISYRSTVVGCGMTLVMSSGDDNISQVLLEMLGFPFADRILPDFGQTFYKEQDLNSLKAFEMLLEEIKKKKNLEMEKSVENKEKTKVTKKTVVKNKGEK